MNTNTKKKYNHWSEDIQQSIEDFNLIVPILESFGFTNLRTLEEHLTNEDYELDIKYGIDVIGERNGKQISFASRIQRTEKDFYSFSLRDSRWTGSKTETKKRIEQIENNDIYPTFTYQAFVNKDNEVTSLGLCRTKDLYWLIENKTNIFGYRYSDNGFWYCRFDLYKKFKKILIYNK